MVSAMTRVGLIARADIKGGLGIQTYRLNRLLKPHKVMLINSTSFNGNQQYPEKYDNIDCYIDGFPNPQQITKFCQDVDVVISCELFYSYQFVDIAKANNVKTVLIFNYEFNDYLQNPSLSLPDKMIQPSYWYLDEMKARFNAEYLPTPIFEDEFKQAREINYFRSLERTPPRPRYLFLNGKTAAHDRAGLESLYEALQLAKGDFEVVVKAQGEIKKHPDPRLTYDFSNPEEQWKLYAGFDAMIHPRRYGGQSLPMTEALQSGLPVIMTDIDPNNKVLPENWLIPAEKTGEFMARAMIDIYSADPDYLANKIDTFKNYRLTIAKEKAIEIAKQYDAETLRPEYEELIK